MQPTPPQHQHFAFSFFRGSGALSESAFASRGVTRYEQARNGRGLAYAVVTTAPSTVLQIRQCIAGCAPDAMLMPLATGECVVAFADEEAMKQHIVYKTVQSYKHPEYRSWSSASASTDTVETMSIDPPSLGTTTPTVKEPKKPTPEDTATTATDFAFAYPDSGYISAEVFKHIGIMLLEQAIDDARRNHVYIRVGTPVSAADVRACIDTHAARIWLLKDGQKRGIVVFADGIVDETHRIRRVINEGRRLFESGQPSSYRVWVDPLFDRSFFRGTVLSDIPTTRADCKTLAEVIAIASDLDAVITTLATDTGIDRSLHIAKDHEIARLHIAKDHEIARLQQQCVAMEQQVLAARTAMVAKDEENARVRSLKCSFDESVIAWRAKMQSQAREIKTLRAALDSEEKSPSNDEATVATEGNNEDLANVRARLHTAEKRARHLETMVRSSDRSDRDSRPTAYTEADIKRASEKADRDAVARCGVRMQRLEEDLQAAKDRVEARDELVDTLNRKIKALSIEKSDAWYSTIVGRTAEEDAAFVEEELRRRYGMTGHCVVNE